MAKRWDINLLAEWQCEWWTFTSWETYLLWRPWENERFARCELFGHDWVDTCHGMFTGLNWAVSLGYKTELSAVCCAIFSSSDKMKYCFFSIFYQIWGLHSSALLVTIITYWQPWGRMNHCCITAWKKRGGRGQRPADRAAPALENTETLSLKITLNESAAVSGSHSACIP